MRKNCLFICNTSFQIMMALLFRMTILKEDDVDIFVSDILPGAEELSANIKQSNAFSEVFLCKEYDIDKTVRQQNRYTAIKNMIWRGNICKDILKNITKRYDELYTSDVFYTTNVMYEKLLKYNSDIKVYYFEENPFKTLNEGGPFEDLAHYQGIGLMSCIKKIFGVKSIQGNIAGAYTVVYKEMSKRYFQWLDVPKIPRSDLSTYIKIANSFWKYDEHAYTNLNGIVYMEGAYFTDGFNSFDDLAILNDIKECVDNEQITVKLHPRTRVNRFAPDFNVMECNSLPWELFMLNNSSKNLVTITIASTSAFLSKMYWDIDQKSIMLQDCEDYYFPELDEKGYRIVSDQCKQKGLAYLPKTKKEFQDILKELIVS